MTAASLAAECIILSAYFGPKFDFALHFPRKWGGGCMTEEASLRGMGVHNVKDIQNRTACIIKRWRTFTSRTVAGVAFSVFLSIPQDPRGCPWARWAPGSRGGWVAVRFLSTCFPPSCSFSPPCRYPPRAHGHSSSNIPFFPHPRRSNGLSEFSRKKSESIFPTKNSRKGTCSLNFPRIPSSSLRCFYHGYKSFQIPQTPQTPHIA